ncbi:GntR family transcriptional regulator [Streptomyces phaeofaciens JCM 4814]|uniref:GntR family transcriptional regulator n=1 Tax=Streptomyces phaeofaciens TaxID=68254 RepID=A0A918HN64_9ACTN|nr:GntR family transcriptional regulator [Streptomyces phaeofaciens]
MDRERYGRCVDAQRSGDSGGREFQRVSEELRARIADGTYPLNLLLPSQRDLAAEFDVSRDTVQKVLKELAQHGLIESRQGSGSRVLRVPRTQPSVVADGRLRGGRTLGSLLGEAFERAEVTLDVFSLTSESLAAHLMVQAERIIGGFIAPESIALRLILPSVDLVLPYPRSEADPDDPRLRDRFRRIADRSTDTVSGLFRDLEEYVPSVGIAVRRAPLTPTCKLYLLNGAHALLAPYEVIERDITVESGESIRALDVLGFGAPLAHHVRNADPDSPDTLFVDSWQRWFDSVWNRLAR